MLTYCLSHWMLFSQCYYRRSHVKGISMMITEILKKRNYYKSLGFKLEQSSSSSFNVYWPQHGTTSIHIAQACHKKISTNFNAFKTHYKRGKHPDFYSTFGAWLESPKPRRSQSTRLKQQEIWTCGCKKQWLQTWMGLDEDHYLNASCGLLGVQDSIESIWKVSVDKLVPI